MNHSNESRTEKPQVVVVTGASAGVGRAVVREFARTTFGYTTGYYAFHTGRYVVQYGGFVQRDV